MTESQYQKACEQQAWEEEFIGKRMAYHMQNSCDPYDSDRFVGAIIGCGDDSLNHALKPLLRGDKLDYAAIGKAIVDWVIDRLEKEAEELAELDLERDKEYCDD